MIGQIGLEVSKGPTKVPPSMQGVLDDVILMMQAKLLKEAKRSEPFIVIRSGLFKPTPSTYKQALIFPYLYNTDRGKRFGKDCDDEWKRKE